MTRSITDPLSFFFNKGSSPHNRTIKYRPFNGHKLITVVFKRYRGWLLNSGQNFIDFIDVI